VSEALHDAERLQEDLNDGLAGLVDEFNNLGIEARIESGLSGLREAIASAATEAKAGAKRISEALEEVRRFEVQIGELEDEQMIAAELGRLLSATGFERWLVAEALDTLVEGASTTLERLSSGQYALARDERNEFLVTDHANADERRLAKTLSGGETFQASLALALALADRLADMAAGGTAQLDSIFLDEGFGTLDPDTLAVVADTIETLGHEERMVGVITHVRELAERIPVRFIVTKGPRTSTVERVRV
jgi:exonuclease SbcC